MVTERKPPPYIAPPLYGAFEAASFQALQNGNASPHQQQTALRWLIEAAAGTYNLSFSPESDRATSFAEGRRFVGLQVVKLLKMDVNKLKKGDDNG